jgi:hypothetical protein
MNRVLDGGFHGFFWLLASFKRNRWHNERKKNDRNFVFVEQIWREDGYDLETKWELPPHTN